MAKKKRNTYTEEVAVFNEIYNSLNKEQKNYIQKSVSKHYGQSEIEAYHSINNFKTGKLSMKRKDRLRLFHRLVSEFVDIEYSEMFAFEKENQEEEVPE